MKKQSKKKSRKIYLAGWSPISTILYGKENQISYFCSEVCSSIDWVEPLTITQARKKAKELGTSPTTRRCIYRVIEVEKIPN